MEKGTTDITDIVFSQQNKEREEKEEEEESIVGNPKEIEKEEEKEKNCGDDSDQNGGVLSGLIAGILHPSQESDETETETETETQSGATLMDNIVSHLPAPLSDDAAPATEEASILIHAIVHD